MLLEQRRQRNEDVTALCRAGKSEVSHKAAINLTVLGGLLQKPLYYMQHQQRYSSWRSHNTRKPLQLAFESSSQGDKNSTICHFRRREASYKEEYSTAE